MSKSAKVSSGTAQARIRHNIPLYLMFLPGAIYLLINNYIPMAGLVIAFKQVNWNKGILKSPWVGFSNFEYLFKTKEAWNITRNTLGYNIIFIILGTVIAIAVAILLNEITSMMLKKTYQTVILLPYLISMVVVSYLVYAMLSSENGFVNLIYEDDWFIGMESEWGLKERELRYLYTGERYRTLAGTKPAIMARIVCMPEFVKNIRLSEACPEDEVTVEIGIHDLFIPQNQGAWIWKLNKSGSEIIQESRFIAKGKLEVFTIAELTQWLFGYALPEQVENVPYGQYIEPFHGVFLDEVV